jgi:hypothetical protein
MGKDDFPKTYIDYYNVRFYLIILQVTMMENKKPFLSRAAPEEPMGVVDDLVPPIMSGDPCALDDAWLVGSLDNNGYSNKKPCPREGI